MLRNTDREHLSSKEMKRELLHRLMNLELRNQVQRRQQKSRFPAWLIAEWQKQEIPLDDHGIFDWSQMKSARRDGD